MRRVLQLLASLLYALTGQAADVWTTKLGAAQGLKEQNPLLRGFVEQQRFGQILAFKLGLTLVVAAAVELSSRKWPGGRSGDEALRVAGAWGWFAAGWNLIQIGNVEKRRKSGRGPLVP